ncbi:uncharacterized protein LOC131309704 isoform X1 [Rhododendron vialii]|uniref:uncharacterized protein LOC131309704 isoform X1 n=2 Tax=Rhododendron vialii TaxID=182163 RepID=UPI00265EBA36|nr:uncharacterized protein LOC131309704 isoform X1 [Rhododendron vialii]
MESKENINQYRQRLDKTLASHDLVNEEALKTLVKNQMMWSSQCEVEECTDNLIEKRTNEVSNFLQMLRCASVVDYDGSKTKETCQRGWKVKQDTEEYRVMYREGPQGTPFHTLLVEGFVDGPLDVCLCISWESTLYNKWWPQTRIPTFKILASDCLQRVRIGEQISLVRMKVSWPLSTREAVVHFFEFEYFQDDLVVVLLKSISDLESVDRSTHGFTKDGIPDVQDVVRIDVVGGFAMQKVNAGRSYFRTIANLDIKLDFVPPSFINFVSRQLLGSGFRLYKKEVASASEGNEDFGKVLRGALYSRIRKALYPDRNQNMSINPENCDKESCLLPPEHAIKPVPVAGGNTDTNAFSGEESRLLAPEHAIKPVLVAGGNTDMNAFSGEESRLLAPEHAIKPVLVAGGNTDTRAFSGDYAPESFPEDQDNVGSDYKACTEIEEIEEVELENSQRLEQHHKEIYAPTKSESSESCVQYTKKGDISAEVKHALETLEKVIFFIREYGLAPRTRSLLGLGKDELMDSGGSAVLKYAKPSEVTQISKTSGVVSDKVSENKTANGNQSEPWNSSTSISSRHAGSNSYSREANHNKIVPASPEEDIPRVSEIQQTAFPPSNNELTNEPTSDGGTHGNKPVNADDNRNCISSKTKGKNKKTTFCCLHFIAG